MADQANLENRLRTPLSEQASSVPTPTAPAATVRAPLLAVRQACKRFPGVLALDHVDLDLFAGEVVAVLGENGAGKSTLMRVLAGVQRLDSGAILWAGQPVELHNVQQALGLGIALIHQELNLAHNLNVAANIFLGREPTRWGVIDQRASHAKARVYLEQVGLDVTTKQLVGELSTGQQQLVEIAKALSANARILIMDEPTSSLSQKETDRLFAVVRDLRDRGVCIVYISHRLGEVQALADRAVVLRDGRNAGELPRDRLDHDSIVRLMVGRDLQQFFQRQPHTPGAPQLVVENLATTAFANQQVHFAIRAGEIVGIAGLVGAGRTELLRAIFGIDQPVTGSVRVAGQPVAPGQPFAAIEAGIGLVPEDRKAQGLILDWSIRWNLDLAQAWRHRWAGLIHHEQQEKRTANEMIQRLQIKTPHPWQVTQVLSGGNQQKVVLGKWLTLRPAVLLLDEPTRGIDVGAKQEIYHLMHELASQGTAILFVSSELEEIIGVADRALVLHEGRITGELARAELNEVALMNLAVGGTNEQARGS